MIVCICRRVSDRKILEVIQEGAGSVAEVGKACGAGTGCGSCKEQIRCLIDDGDNRDCPRLHAPLLSPYLQPA